MFTEESIQAALQFFQESEDSYLEHYGTPRHSGRYPWGSGDNPYQHNSEFLRQTKEMKASGMSEIEIATSLGFRTTSELRSYISQAANYNKLQDIKRIKELKEQGYNNTEIGRKLGMAESSVRSKLQESVSERAKQLDTAKDILRERVANGYYVDVGAGTEYMLNISRDRLNNVVQQLYDEGYSVHDIQVEQAGNPGKYTKMRVLAAPGVEGKEVNANRENIKTVYERVPEEQRRYQTDKLEYPKSMDSNRIQIRYAEEGGVEKDGVIELRRGVEDISLGNSMYAQVRIAVDGTHYMKGMAVYSDNMPDGVDVIFNTNKSVGTPKEKVFKELKNDPNNPFGATIMEGGQRRYIDANGNEQLSVINKVNDQGKWGEWSKTLASQMLSKQPVSLIKKQLGISYDEKKEEFDTIMAIQQPTLKRYLLQSFAEDCDAASVDLKAAAMPRQASHVILPIPSLKENEIYAPNYNDGETVVLIRYPHGGKFEIPELTVNNRNKEALGIIRNAPDAVGINAATAERLSGADFDGDTVLVIPNNNHAIKTAKPLQGLVGFDPKREYKLPDDAPKMKSQTKQTEMGKVSNLITDMTLKGATDEELARAVRHSMVVIDAEKHHLDYKRSAIDNGIDDLKRRYQNGGGASTLISKASGEYHVKLRKADGLNFTIDPLTGKKIYKEETDPRKIFYTDKHGKVVEKKTKSTQMAEYDDAFELSSGTLAENEYASYANKLKALANTSRKESLGLKQKLNPSSVKTYEEEVKSLDTKLRIAKRNAPYERQAQIAANAMAKIKIDAADQEPSGSEKARIRGQCLNAARANVGATKKYVDITPEEWNAIQVGAISDSKLMDIFKNTKAEDIKRLAMPRENKVMSDSKVSLARSLANSGYTTKQIAERLGVSTSTIGRAINGKEN